MSQQRWDIVLKVLDGPLASMGEQVFRGPVVRIGSNPGPGGFKLSGYRGLDARQCVITAYDGGTVSVAPVGNNQIRMAPHQHVNWKEIDPIGGPSYLNEGAAIHLGPVGRGATLEFVRAKSFAEWQAGRAASQAADVQAAELTHAAPAVPQAIDARKVRGVSATKVPIWFLGCLFLMASSTVVVIAALVIVVARGGRDIKELGPKEDGDSRYLYVSADDAAKLPKNLKEGLNQAFHDFVAVPNAEAAGRRRLESPENWDQDFYNYTAAALDQHLSAWNVFRRLEVVRDDYAHVVTEMRRAGLPEVFAAVPYVESLYNPEAQSFACAKGYWQFMPELAYRLNVDKGLDFRVAKCSFVDARTVEWKPKHKAPPARRDREYLTPDNQCRIPEKNGCKVDDRTDLAKSTAAAIVALGEAWEDPTIQSSGAAVEITILSHNAGYDDSRFGYRRKTNLLPAFKRWSKGKDEDDWHRFYGQNIKCATHLDEGLCGSAIPAETQHYAYRIAAIHMIASCYYGQSYGDRSAFKAWGKYTHGDGYCVKLNVPTSQEVKNRGRGK